jgi:phosphoenolpyruvate carboxylase
MQNGRCHLHGGKSLKGPASATYQGKGFSKYFPSKKLGDIFTRSFEDPELTRLRKDLAIVETRLVELIQSLNSQQSGTLWKQIRKKHRELKRSKAKKATKLLQEIGELIESGSSNQSIWAEIGQQIELRRRLLDSETKRIFTAHQIMTGDDVRMFIDAVASLIHEHVKDRKALQKISEGLVGFIDVEAKIVE